METLNEYEIFNLTSKTCGILINRTVEITMKDNWRKEQKIYAGVIELVGLAANHPHQPVDVRLVLPNGETESLSILHMNQIIFS